MKQSQEKMLKAFLLLIPLLGLICIAASVIYAIKELELNGAVYGGFIVGVLLFLTLFLKTEAANLKFYLNVFVYSVLVAGVCVVLYLFASQYTKQWDLTKQRLYSLTEQSEQFLGERLKEEVTITILTPLSEQFQPMERLYTEETDKVKFEYVNDVKDPLGAQRVAEAMKVESVRAGDVFVSSGDRNARLSVTELIGGNFENVLTNAIVQVTATGKSKLYFTIGHGELPLEPGQAQRGEVPMASASMLANMIRERGMEAATLDLARVGSVPDDATVVVVAGPASDLLPAEAEALGAFLNQGGKVMVLLDIARTSLANPPAFENLKGVLSAHGVELPQEIVLDVTSARIGGSAEQPMVATYDAEHPITRRLSSVPSRVIIGPTRPVRAGKPGDNRMQAVELLKSSELSFTADIATALSGRMALPERDQLSAVPLAVAVGPSAPPQMPGMAAPSTAGMYRLAVFGNSDLAADQMMRRDVIRLVMMNTVNWLAEREDALDIPPRQVPGTPIVLDKGQMRVVFVLAIVLIPAGLFFGGVSYSMMRRRR